MKKNHPVCLLALLLVLLLLAGCAHNIEESQQANQNDNTPTADEQSEKTDPPEVQTPPQDEQPEQPDETAEPENVVVFTHESFPNMDGSTALVPLGQAVAIVLLGECREDVADLAQFKRTTQ